MQVLYTATMVRVKPEQEKFHMLGIKYWISSERQIIQLFNSSVIVQQSILWDYLQLITHCIGWFNDV